MVSEPCLIAVIALKLFGSVGLIRFLAVSRVNLGHGLVHQLVYDLSVRRKGNR